MSRRERASAENTLYFVRHAPAEDRHPLGDGARGLTAEGRAAFRLHAAAVTGQIRLRGIATSPLVRAVQTAEILAEAAGLAEVRVEAALDLSVASVRGLAALARTLGPGWALVGHNPSLAETVGRLAGQADAVRFKKGAVAALELPRAGADGSWALAWIWAPGREPSDVG